MSEAAKKMAVGDLITLTKPKVVLLLVFTAFVGMLLAVDEWTWGHVLDVIFGCVGIGLAAASAAAINHLVDQRADAIMARTKNRPMPSGTVNNTAAMVFAALLGSVSMVMLVFLVNPLTAVLTFFALIGYAVIYTMYLKRATPQNIVIGGLAGAMPPVLGWAAINNEVHAYSLVLALIIYVWTPPHFWALAVNRREEYAKVDIPMLPVTHGAELTRFHITLYTILLFGVTLLPYLMFENGVLYLVGSVLLNLRFLWYAFRLQRTRDDRLAMRMFVYSIYYLMWLFALLILDKYLRWYIDPLIFS
ncbi:MAG: heme o synthase [Pseudomonadota bacterium]